MVSWFQGRERQPLQSLDLVLCLPLENGVFIQKVLVYIVDYIHPFTRTSTGDGGNLHAKHQHRLVWSSLGVQCFTQKDGDHNHS